jgi:hypothetical protein
MFKAFMETINNIDTRIFALVVVGLGLVACVLKQNQAGTLLIGGGLTAFQQKPAPPA